MSCGGAAGGARCEYWVARKKRPCRMTVRAGGRHCGEHAPPSQPSQPSQQIDPRIPCPLDPKHTCYASKLSKHLLVCNAKAVPAPPYISRGCNASPADSADSRLRLKDVPTETLKAVVEFVERLYFDLVADTIVQYEEQEIHTSVRGAYWSEERGRSSRRHLHQTSSLISILESEGLVRPGTCFVELGAGKGHVSYYLSLAVSEVPATRVLLVDRASHRHKQDNKLADSVQRAARLRADIADLLLAEVESVRDSQCLVAVSKHLCGIATDLALRCMTAPSIEEKACGVVMATCCHHRCTAGSYVAPDFLKVHGITKEYFDIMMGIVSWATCGTGFSRERRSRMLDQTSKRQKTDHNPSLEGNINNTRKTIEGWENVDEIYDFERDKNESDNADQNKSEINANNDDAMLPLDGKPLTSSYDEDNKTNGHTQYPDVSVSDKMLPDVRKDSKTDSNDNKMLPDVGKANKTYINDIKKLPNAGNGNKTDFNVATNLSDVKDKTGNNDVMLSDSEIDGKSPASLLDVKGLGLTLERRTEVGRRAKALLDYGRCVYLRGCGFETKLCYYVDQDVSPENVCIVAKKL